MAKKWMESKRDRILLETLYRFGPLTAQAVIITAGQRNSSYKRLWWLREMGLLNSVAYCVKVGERKKIKKAEIYYLTKNGMKYVMNTKNLTGHPQNDRPRESDMELRYRISVFLVYLYNNHNCILKTGKEVRKAHKMPNNVSINFKTNQTAIHFVRNKINQRTIKWLENSVEKLKISGVAKYHIIIAAGPNHRTKLAMALMQSKIINTHILLPHQVHLLDEVQQIPKRMESRLRELFTKVQVTNNLVFLDEPAYTVDTGSRKFYAADVSTFSISQLRSLQYFNKEKAKNNGFNPIVFVVIESSNDFYNELIKILPKIKYELRGSALDLPALESYCKIKPSRSQK